MKIKYTSEGGSGFIVVANGQPVATAASELEALQAAENYLEDNAAAVLYVTSDLKIHVEPLPAPAPAPAPTPAPTTTTDPATTTTTVQPTANAVRINYVDPIDSSAKYYDVAYSRVLFVSADGNGDGSELNPLSPTAIFQHLSSGTLFMFRGGQYMGNYGGNWGARNFALGASASGVSFVAKSGEVVTLVSPDPENHTNFSLIDTTQTYANDVTIAGFVMQGGGGCIFGGGYGQLDASGNMIKGAHRGALIANKFSARYTGNSMSGLIAFQGDGWKVLGNEFADTGWTAFYNNNHAAYAQSGALDFLIEANRFNHLQVGHVIQVHQDGIAQTYRGTIRRNKLIAADPMNMRGITVSNVADDSTVLIEENLLDTVGQQFSGFSQYGGQVTLKNNTFRNILGSTVGKIWLSNQYSHNPILYRQGNIIDGGSGPDYGVSGVPAENIKDL